LQWYPFKKPGEISEVCVEQENDLDSNFGNFLPQNIEMMLAIFDLGGDFGAFSEKTGTSEAHPRG
jgi:hypothetical protein